MGDIAQEFPHGISLVRPRAVNHVCRAPCSASRVATSAAQPRPTGGEGGNVAGNRGWDAPCLSDQESGFRFGAGGPAGSIPMKRVAAPERTRERLRALMDGRLGTAPARSNLVLLAAQLIVEEALEAEVRDEVGRERYERADGNASGYRNG